jgi:hypothetical protein
MSESEGEYKRPRRGHTPPCHETEGGDMRAFLAETFRPALEASVSGSLATAATSFYYKRPAATRKYCTKTTLTYRGKKWVGGANGEWRNQEYELLSFRYLESGFIPEPNSERSARPKAGRVGATGFSPPGQGPYFAHILQLWPVMACYGLGMRQPAHGCNVRAKRQTVGTLAAGQFASITAMLFSLPTGLTGDHSG